MRFHKNVLALGRLKPGEMGKLEREYSYHLDAELRIGNILWWKFQGMKFRLADKSFYTPDFNVMKKGCELEQHEVKGHWIGDSRTKIKVAAELYPMKFLAVTKALVRDGGGWVYEEI